MWSIQRWPILLKFLLLLLFWHLVRSKFITWQLMWLQWLMINPICLEDLICLPPNAAAILGNIGPIVFCSNVSNDMELDRYIGSIP
ncbi:transmembrane protein, putative [Medicago truncatula]|uniref:Transmembrane protein, putative n=1 Tax=Medicago truncatula TaxID=3880 RepID=A0A072TJZ8_MEDTR|nr:transmembrane protein, putative [Medicago truncatula]